MSVSKQILGMNARNFLYLARYNAPRAKFAADNKLATKKLLLKHDIPTAEVIHSFATRKTLRNYSFNLPKDGFVIKPSRGYRGDGILVFKSWDGASGTTISGKNYTLSQLQSHILDIFDGIYSLHSIPDKAYIEKRIIPSPFFKKLAPIGLPDIRVIVFNNVPVMAMLRIPTEESQGRANLHQGALGVGIDIRTGITNHAILKDKPIKFLPGTKVKASGIKIPEWDKILLLSSRAQKVSGLGFAGIDIVVDKNRGPIVLEINARPGLSIQNANLASLRERLERVENLTVNTPDQGVEIARALFAEGFSHRVKEERKILSIVEPVTITYRRKSREYLAKLDTGAYKTSLDTSIIKDLNIPLLKEKVFVKSASGQELRSLVKVNIKLGGKQITTTATVADRSKLQFPLIIGRRDLKGFYINPLLPTARKIENFLDDDSAFDYEDSLKE